MARIDTPRTRSTPAELPTPPGEPPILVTGATGRVGRAVTDLLTDAGVPVRALVRRAESAAELPGTVEIVTGDLTVPGSLDAALAGVSTVLLVWTAPPQTAAAVVDRLAAHARRVVHLSAPHRTPHPFFQQPNPMAALHAEIERLIAATGLDSTIVRPGMFASNALSWWATAVRGDGVVRWPHGAAETAPVDDRDVAEVVARTLREDGHVGGDYVLTGPESLTQAEQVRILGDALGRRLTFEELPPDEFRQQSPQAARPAVDMLLAAWNAATGRPAHVTSTVSELLGRPARTFHQWATDHATSFTGTPPGPSVARSDRPAAPRR
ncbi:NAD(P)H-binding protein [Micromonospora sp. NBC_00421]|uniref:NAD(P)H-binding protein n=1 Tax=Micromonospora sp. NBC_00421 TaxID=2975976 RepID=UPI002E1E706E